MPHNIRRGKHTSRLGKNALINWKESGKHTIRGKNNFTRDEYACKRGKHTFTTE